MRPIPFDIETTGLDPIVDKIVTIQLGDKIYQVSEPFFKETSNMIPPFNAIVQAEVAAILSDPEIPKVCHNAHFEKSWMLTKYGLTINNCQDSQIAAFVTSTRAPGGKSGTWTVALKPLSDHLFKDADTSDFDFFESFGGIEYITRYLYLGEPLAHNMSGMFVSPTEIMKRFIHYALNDNDLSLRVWEYIVSQPLWVRSQAVYSIELGFLDAIIAMERRGIKLDTQAMLEQKNDTEQLLQETEQTLYRVAGKEFNPKGDEAMQVLLDAGIKLERKSPKSGKFKMDRKTLIAFSDNELVSKLLDYKARHYSLANHIEPVLKAAGEEGVVRTHINAMGAGHGRHSSYDPNLLNIPKRGSNIRKCFVPREGFTFYMFDWSLIEMVLAAYFSKEPALVGPIRANADLHRLTAAAIYGKPPDQVTADERTDGKIANFLCQYGGGYSVLAVSLVENLRITYAEAEKKAKVIVNAWREAYPGIRRANSRVADKLLSDEMQEKLHHDFMEQRKLKNDKIWEYHNNRTEKYQGYIINPYGRVWRPDAPEYHYTGFQALVSGTATGDMSKEKTVEIHNFLKQKKSQIVLNIYDELLIEVADGEEWIVPKIKEMMESFPWMNSFVPIRVDISRSRKNWYEKEQVYDAKTETWLISMPEAC